MACAEWNSLKNAQNCYGFFEFQPACCEGVLLFGHPVQPPPPGGSSVIRPCAAVGHVPLIWGNRE